MPLHSIRIALASVVLLVPVFVAAELPQDPCRDKEYWFETGIGYFSEGYSLEETQKRGRSLYKSMTLEQLSEDEALAIVSEAWQLLSSINSDRQVGQLERLGLAHQYYLQCSQSQ
ncbi:MAG: hypothetical protein AAGI44_13220 [Pseudomonadota bacterium]